MPIVDTNVVLRYILNDNESFSPLARDIFDRENIWISIEVLAEVVYVLKSVYEVPRSEIGEQLIAFIDSSGVSVENKATVIKSLHIFSVENMGYIDCLLAARAVTENDQVITFDKKLRHYIDSTLDGHK